VDDEDALASRKRRAPVRAPVHRAGCGAELTRYATAQQARGAPSAPREPKPQKHIITAYNRDNQMLLRRKKARPGALR
jgi:hypothetical protein